ncbi:hypothetical protein [Herbiconiux flava]|uniref:Cell division protein FtsL n=1 Tax=Herbiconiux flava TaxID=881268 RepID=A0A852SR96_9MICO|nr:hypothetical protein [Herbiconiux flava]NYD71230.1 cell division protein FtsL [Herbiconiux flava]GLK18806.1 hypothetical protein GCM10017602_32880 [Herbiconiux flava]
MTNLASASMSRPRAAFAQAVAVEPDFDLDLPGVGHPIAPRRIQVVPTRQQRRARPKIAYAAVVVTGVLAIVITQLMLSIGLSDGAYEISSLQQQQKELDRTNQTLSEQYDSLSSPQNLAASAESLGMVANSAPVYLRLSDGAVLGSPVAAGATGSVTGGQSLIPNASLNPVTGTAATPADAAAAAAAGAAADAAATADTASAPPVAEAPADVPWTGALPSPTTR